MNRFLTHEGRQPIWLDDIDFIQNTLADEIKKIVWGVMGFGEELVILSGCEKTLSDDGLFQFSKGIIYYGGELLAVPEASFTKDGDFRFRIVETLDPAGDRILADSGEEVGCYQLRSAYIALPITTSGRPDTAPRVAGAKRLDDIMKARTAEDVLYNGELNGFRITLIRKDGTYLLSGNFDTYSQSVIIPMTDEKAVNEICESYRMWESLQGNPHINNLWSHGETYGVGVNQVKTSGIEPASTFVTVRALSDHPDYPSVPWILEINLSRSGSSGYGGFNMMLNRKID